MRKNDNQRKSFDDIQKIVETEVKRQLSVIRGLIYAFMTGLTITIIVGLSFREVFLLPLMKYIYPPKEIYSEMKTCLSDDRSLLKSETLRNEVKDVAWEAMLSGDQSRFSKLTSQNCFYLSLEEKFDDELINAFGIPGSVFAGELNQNEKLRQTILKMGGDIQRADIRMVAKNMNGDTTSCGRKFRHDQLHAIIRIPEAAAKEKYAWLRCGGVASPMYLIEISANERKLGGIKLVSIERNGTTDSLELKVSLEIAKQLDLPDWRTYRARVIGSYKLTDVYWD